jgi:hypothetical protein
MTALYGEKNMLTFNGIPVQDMSISMVRDVMDFTSLAHSAPLFAPDLRQAELDCRLVIFDAENYQAVDDMINRLLDCDNSFVNLGPGHVCKYCGEYKVAGELKCHRCGGMTKVEKFAAVDAFPFLLAAYSVNNTPIGMITIDVRMVACGTIYNTTIESLTWGVNLDTLPHTLSLDPSKYLCDWCGMVVESGKACPGCGGTRLPWSEMVKLERACLYCGRQVTGGIVCQSCGARLSGLSYRMVKGNYSSNLAY